ncbi:MAG: hypothetical protein WA268_27840, partial [Xanthobacteraceae bacterium]
AIDGKRTLSEIIQSATRRGVDERRVVRFFERLWQYDQVVFDASRAAASLQGSKVLQTRGAEATELRPEKKSPGRMP